MVRAYSRYEHTSTFGTVATSSSNCLWTTATTQQGPRVEGPGRVYVGANEEVLCWDVKTGELTRRWRDKDSTAAVTSIARSADPEDLFAVGYSDGSIKIWDDVSSTVVITFNGHRSAVTCLDFDQTGTRLVSGSRDTNIVLWNLVSEVAEFKLRGHKDQITAVQFLIAQKQAGDRNLDLKGETNDGSAYEDIVEEPFLISTSKDALIKLWDLTGPNCIETHVTQSNGECWAFGLSQDGRGLITAGNDGEMKVWSVDVDGLASHSALAPPGETRSFLKQQGTLLRHGRDRPIGVKFHKKQDYFAVYGTDKAVEIWRMRSDEEVAKLLARKRRRKRERFKDKNDENTVASIQGTAPLLEATVADTFVQYVIVRPGGRVRAMDWATNQRKKSLDIIVSLTNNQIESYHVPAWSKTQSKNEEPPDYSRISSIDLPGHRTDIRAIALSSDDRMLMTASTGLLKIWNVLTRSCLRTLDCGHALCCSFLPGDKIVLVGTKSGDLELFDIASASLLERIKAHDGALWSMQVHPDGKSLATGSADKSVKFWRFDIISKPMQGVTRVRQQLQLVHMRTLKVADEVLSLCFSPNSRLIAVSTLDNSVRVFFEDSLKLYLTLYGHKLPVLDMSIALDSKLIATCSADKNIRLWGLDFGDCHKALFAHKDSVMCVRFIPHAVQRDESHQLFSASKDGTLKSWDGDKFEQVQKLSGHHGEIWAMAVSRTGEKVITASHDKSIRVWELTDDPIFLEEEREKELEEVYENTLTESFEKEAHEAEFGVDENERDEVVAATKQSLATLTHGEKLMEALELGFQDLQLMQTHTAHKQLNPKAAAPARNAMLQALNVSAEVHVMQILGRIPRAALRDALLVLPFAMVPTLCEFAAIMIEKRLAPESAWRAFSFAMMVHHDQIVASRQLKPIIDRAWKAFRQWVDEERAVIGYNIAGLEFLCLEAQKRQVRSIDDIDETIQNPAKGRQKRVFASIA